jgi:hypothetical protein
VFVDQPVRYGYPADSLDIEVDCRNAGSFALMAGNPLADALMRAVLWWAWYSISGRAISASADDSQFAFLIEGTMASPRS